MDQRMTGSTHTHTHAHAHTNTPPCTLKLVLAAAAAVTASSSPEHAEAAVTRACCEVAVIVGPCQRRHRQRVCGQLRDAPPAGDRPHPYFGRRRRLGHARRRSIPPVSADCQAVHVVAVAVQLMHLWPQRVLRQMLLQRRAVNSSRRRTRRKVRSVRVAPARHAAADARVGGARSAADVVKHCLVGETERRYGGTKCAALGKLRRRRRGHLRQRRPTRCGKRVKEDLWQE
eukprot:365123-Chlamydomonas_euryale.AAC.9